MTNPTQPKTGTVTINGRVYTHYRICDNGKKWLLRRLDISVASSVEPWAELLEDNKYETVCCYLVNDVDIVPIPATTTRPRELKDVVAELAKGGVPWFSDDGKEWFLQTSYISQGLINLMNKEKHLFSPNPFKENPTIIGPEIPEELKP